MMLRDCEIFKLIKNFSNYKLETTVKKIKIMIALTLLILSASSMAYFNSSCGFKNRAECDDWFSANGLMGSSAYHQCCDKLPLILNSTAMTCFKVGHCPYYFPNRGACDNWFAAAGLLDTPSYHDCCDKLPK